MRGRCQLGGAGAFQQHRVGKPADPRDVGARRRGHLLDGRTGANFGLNFFGAQHVCDYNIELRLLLRWRLAAQDRMQPFVGHQLELFCGFFTLADDVFAVVIEPNHFEFPHGFSLQAPCTVSHGPIRCAL